MNLNRLVVAGLVLAMVRTELVACITLISLPTPQQLPEELFKLPVHIEVEAMTIDLPLPGGTAKMPLRQKQVDPVASFERVIADYEGDPARHASFANRNDYAGALIFSGRTRDAIPVLEQLEADFPGKYSTALTLGTAYELIDDLPNAIKWIGAGIARKPESHEDTEWLHLAILDAKQKLKTDPRWLSSHSVLDGSRDRGLGETQRALEFQLNERLYFIKDRDPVMCDLFYEAARLADNGNKRGYFARQAKRFGDIRTRQIADLAGVPHG